MTNFSTYIHASREMTAHLTRCASTQYITTKQFIDVEGYNKTSYFVSHQPLQVGSHPADVHYNTLFIDCLLYTSDAADE